MNTNEYANLANIINTQNANVLINKMNELTKERLLHNMRKRILTEIHVLEIHAFELEIVGHQSKPDWYVPFSDQLQLIEELFEYGFIDDVKTCLDIMEKRITEIQAELLPWFKMCKDRFGFKVNGPKKGKKLSAPIFLETYFINNDMINAAYCFKPLVPNIEDAKWFNVCFSIADFLYFMQQEGYDYLFTNITDPLPLDLFSTTVKTHLATYILENTEKLIKQYIQLGYELTEI